MTLELVGENFGRFAKGNECESAVTNRRQGHDFGRLFERNRGLVEVARAMVEGVVSGIEADDGVVGFADFDFDKVGIKDDVVLHRRKIYDALAVGRGRPYDRHIIESRRLCKFESALLTSFARLDDSRALQIRSCVKGYEHTALSRDLNVCGFAVYSDGVIERLYVAVRFARKFNVGGIERGKFGFYDFSALLFGYFVTDKTFRFPIFQSGRKRSVVNHFGILETRLGKGRKGLHEHVERALVGKGEICVVEILLHAFKRLLIDVGNFAHFEKALSVLTAQFLAVCKSHSERMRIVAELVDKLLRFEYAVVVGLKGCEIAACKFRRVVHLVKKGLLHTL